MPEDSFGFVREALLSAGIPPRQVHRYVIELTDHLSELVARERASGRGLLESEKVARRLLGTDAQLIQAVLESGEPRAMAAKAPWAVFGVVPIFALTVLLALLASWFIVVLYPYRDLAAQSLPADVSAIAWVISTLGNYFLGPLVATACIVVALRQRIVSAWIWAGLFMIAVACGLFGIHWHSFPPTGSTSGGIRGSVILQAYDQGNLDVAMTRLLVSVRIIGFFAISAATYLFLRRRLFPAGWSEASTFRSGS